MVTDDTLMRDLEDQGENPMAGENDPRFVIEINPESNEAIIEFREPLEFHRDLAETERAQRPNLSRPWSELTDENGYLTAESEQKLTAEFEKILRENGKVTGVTVEYASGLNSTTNHPSAAWSFITTYRDGETYGQWMERIGWPVTAAIVNTTDPGTFNYPYLFTAILYP